MSRETGILVSDLKKTYVTSEKKGLFKSVKKKVEALRGVSFEVHHGEVVGLLGPNGAGKTTTIKILATILLPDSGDAYIEGYHVVKEAHKARKNIGVMLTVEKGFYGKLTGKENLEYFGALMGLKGLDLKRRVKEALEVVGLTDLKAEDRLYEEYSLGMKARLSLARAIMADPPVLLLDEPTLGLDPPSARNIRNLVKDMAKDGKAILYTTHNMFEAEIICDRILLINKGLIVASGTPEELKEKVGGVKAIVVKVGGDPSKLLSTVSEMGLDMRLSEMENGVAVLKASVEKPERYLNDLLHAIDQLGLRVYSLNVQEPSLEDVFILLTKE